MNHNRKRRLALEQLEDRWVPTNIKLAGGNLFITNPFIGAGGVAVTKVQLTGTNTVQVTNGPVTANVTVAIKKRRPAHASAISKRPLVSSIVVPSV